MDTIASSPTPRLRRTRRRKRPPIGRIGLAAGFTSLPDPYKTSIWEQVRRMNRDAIYSATAGALLSLGINPGYYRNELRDVASAASSDIAHYLIRAAESALTKENTRP